MGRVLGTPLVQPPLLAGDLARRAFDAAAGFMRAPDSAALDRTMQPVAASLGFNNVIFTETINGVTRVTAGAPPALWWPHMIASGYAAQDVVFRRALATPTPFFYTDVTGLADLTATQRRIVGERREFGITDGFVNPTRWRNGTVTAVVMAGADIDPEDPDVRAAAHVLSDFYGMAARRLSAPAPAPERPAVTLTVRQLDCLSWVREGKSATDIGTILGISVHTVHEHVAAACARLGVRTRVQAVAAAVALRLIDP